MKRWQIKQYKDELQNETICYEIICSKCGAINDIEEDYNEETRTFFCWNCGVESEDYQSLWFSKEVIWA